MNDEQNKLNTNIDDDWDWDLNETAIPEKKETDIKSNNLKSKTPMDLLNALNDVLNVLEGDDDTDFASSSSDTQREEEIKNKLEDGVKNALAKAYINLGVNSLQSLQNSNDLFGLFTGNNKIPDELKQEINKLNLSDIVTAMNDSDNNLEIFYKRFEAEYIDKDEFIDIFGSDDSFPYEKFKGIIEPKYVSSEDTKLYPEYWNYDGKYVILKEKINDKKLPVSIVVYKNEGTYKSYVPGFKNLLLHNCEDDSVGSALIDIKKITENVSKDIADTFPTVFFKVFDNVISFNKNLDNMFVDSSYLFLNLTNVGTIQRSNTLKSTGDQYFVGELTVNDTFDGRQFLDNFDLSKNTFTYDLYIEFENGFKQLDDTTKEKVISSIDFSDPVMRNYKIKYDTRNKHFYIVF